MIPNIYRAHHRPCRPLLQIRKMKRKAKGNNSRHVPTAKKRACRRCRLKATLQHFVQLPIICHHHDEHYILPSVQEILDPVL